jgi:hypothetical protein
VAKIARVELERKTNQKVVTGENFKSLSGRNNKNQ